MNNEQIKGMLLSILSELKIKQGRQHLNLTQAELAPLLGVSLKTIKNWEQGTRKPSKAALMLLELELKKWRYTYKVKGIAMDLSLILGHNFIPDKEKLTSARIAFNDIYNLTKALDEPKKILELKK